jgi:lactate dehydrogenase-like 2-hydroxyacid dehydrogenase
MRQKDNERFVGKMSEQLGTIINRKRMSVSIIGAGVIGSNVARLLAKSRISARIANKHSPNRWGDSSGNLALGSRLAPLRKLRAHDIVLWRCGGSISKTFLPLRRGGTSRK